MIFMDNITKVVQAGMCVGCGSCNHCEHITFVENELGFLAPVVDDKCKHCGNCLSECIYNPDNED